jgi:hypothetical protein
MRDLELTTAISPCLQIFIESLLDEIDHTRSGSWVSAPRLIPLVLKSDQEQGILQIWRESQWRKTE